jgi:hypothetical protein
MTFVYLLVFVMAAGYGAPTFELKEYSTFEACITAARMAQKELKELSPYAPDIYIARGNYLCLAKPA